MGLLLFWGEEVIVGQIIKFDFCVEVEIEGKDSERKWWVIFLYASIKDNIKRRQWDTLKQRMSQCEKMWIIGGTSMTL